MALLPPAIVNDPLASTTVALCATVLAPLRRAVMICTINSTDPRQASSPQRTRTGAELPEATIVDPGTRTRGVEFVRSSVVVVSVEEMVVAVAEVVVVIPIASWRVAKLAGITTLALIALFSPRSFSR